MLHLITLPLAVLVLAKDRHELVEPPAPWVVVDRPKPERYDCLYNPQIVVRSDGSLVATVTHGGHYGSLIGNYVYKSTNRGSSWSRLATLFTPIDPGLVDVGGRLYLLGTYSSSSTSPGQAGISCSQDGGATWDKITLLSTENRFQMCESGRVVDHGRIWQLFARTDFSGGKVTSHLWVAGAQLGSDLMKSESWTWSDELLQPGFGWHCSVLAPASDEGPILLGRRYGKEVKFVADLAKDGCALRVRSSGDCPQLPDRGILSLDRDPSSGRTFVLEAVERPQHDWGNSEIWLRSSSDLTHWTEPSILVRDEREHGVAFSWCERAYDGEDLVLLLCARVSGTAEVGARAPQRWNVLFLRVPKFRERKPDTPPLWDGSR